MQVLVLGEGTHDLIEMIDATQQLRAVSVETRAQLLAALPTAEAVVADWAGQLALDAAAAANGGVANGDALRLVQYAGAGFHSIDLAAWAARGVPVCNVPEANSQSVAEWAVGATVAACRSMLWFDRELRGGHWAQHRVKEIGRASCRERV